MTDWWLFSALDRGPSGSAVAGLWGDGAARGAAWDYACEHLGAEMIPFEVGQTYLIQTVTLYYVGRVARVCGAFVELEDASWVHWTGRLSTLCARGKFTGFPADENRPRTEYVGRTVGVNMAAVVDYITGPFDLPTKSIQ